MSLFFNAPQTRYKKTTLAQSTQELIERVDISNGLFFLHTNLTHQKIDYSLKKGIDRFIVFVFLKRGLLRISNSITQEMFMPKQNQITVMASSKQELSVNILENEPCEFFALFVADFFLKRYLGDDTREPINFLYSILEKREIIEVVEAWTADAMSFYLIDKIVNIDQTSHMKSLVCEKNILEFMAHRLAFLDIFDEALSDEELYVAKRAKEQICKTLPQPIPIKTLAHLCATNESKLKIVFKKVYGTTIYAFVQKYRLENANILLRESDLTIGEVAKMVGYAHHGNFSKLFLSATAYTQKSCFRQNKNLFLTKES